MPSLSHIQPLLLTAASKLRFQVQRWNEKLGIVKQVEEKSFMHDVEASLLYFKMRKVKKMIAQNQSDMEHAKEEDQMLLLQIHKHLKEVERELTKIIGTVIIK